MRVGISRWSRFLVYMLAGAALFFVFAAPDKEKPEKITVGAITWTTPSSVFDVGAFADASLVERAERGGFLLVTTLEVRDAVGAVVGSLGPQRDAVRALSSTVNSAGMVELAHPLIAWDRNGGTFTGTVAVSASTTMVDAKGKAIARATLLVDGVVVQ